MYFLLLLLLFYVIIIFSFNNLDSLKLFSTTKKPTDKNKDNVVGEKEIIPENLKLTKEKSSIQNQTQKQTTQQKEKEPDSLSDFKIIASVGKYLWPKEWGLRGRVIVSFGLLGIAKLLTIQVPILFKQAIDTLATTPVDPTLTLVPITLLLGYGAARAGSSLFNELRSAIFAAVVQKSVRVKN